MDYRKWLKFAPPNTENLLINKVKKESIDVGEMAAASPSEASLKLARIIEERNAAPKVLVVGDGIFSSSLIDYAIRMGQRLDCELVAVSVLDKNCRKSGLCEEEKLHFSKRAELGKRIFADKASSNGLNFYHYAKVGEKDSIKKQIIKEIAGIRYVLSDPKQQIEEEQNGLVQLPVIDMPGLQ